MDRREFIRQVLRGERGRRIPRALFGAGLWAYQQTGLRIEDLYNNPYSFAETLAGLYNELETDIVFAGSGLNTFPAEAIGGELAYRGRQAPLLSFPLIQKTGDILSLDHIEISHAPRTLSLIDMISRLRNLLRDRYLCATSWGPFTWAMVLCDWHMLQEKCATDRAFITEICDLGVRLSMAFFQPLIDQGVIDAVSIPDGAVTLIPPHLYREVVLPAEKKLFDQVKVHGIGCFLHQCGNIGPQISLYPETGADCVSVDAGVPVGEVYDLFAGRLVVAGNVDVVNTIFAGDAASVCKAVSECISGVSDPYRNYILMPSCDLPPDTPLSNVREFLACAERLEGQGG
jgi:uroporphyrinogen decarboxylase